MTQSKILSPISPDLLREPYCEVKSNEMLDYPTFRPIPSGLFCDRVFGPLLDYECRCGRYKGIKHRGIVCDQCGVEIALSRTRSERLGHIALESPVVHPWFLRPSCLPLLLNIRASSLKRVVYFDDYIVIDPGKTELRCGQPLTSVENEEARVAYGAKNLVTGTGAQAIWELLARIDLANEAAVTELAIKSSSKKRATDQFIRRLQLINAFSSSGARPEWAVLSTLPVIPPQLRNISRDSNNQLHTPAINSLYQKVLVISNRIRRFFLWNVPGLLIRHEKRALQQAVDQLFDTGPAETEIAGAKGNPPGSLADLLGRRYSYYRGKIMQVTEIWEEDKTLLKGLGLFEIYRPDEW